MTVSTPLSITDGWLDSARKVPSPNHNERPADEVSLLVIHNISLPPCQFGGPYIEQLFTNCLDPDAHPFFAGIVSLRVAAHLLIRRDGELVQFVGFDQRAWHAGVSSFSGREGCNDFSIGIEMEGSDFEPFTAVQYQQLAAVTEAIQYTYPQISAERITGHSDIAPGRKTDPGPHFDWEHYRALLPASTKA